MAAGSLSNSLDRLRQIAVEDFSNENSSIFVPPFFNAFEWVALTNGLKKAIAMKFPFDEEILSVIKRECKKNSLEFKSSEFKYINNTNLNVCIFNYAF